jgi:CheY-like chemotaxis protein
MGGRIWVESDGHSGSTFHFVVPFTLDSIDQLDGRSLRLSNKSILLISPHAESRTASRQLLQQCGARVETYAELSTGLAAIEENKSGEVTFDTLIADLGGEEDFVRHQVAQVRQITQETDWRVVLLLPAGKLALDDGSTIYENEAIVTKPYKRTELLEAVQPSEMTIASNQEGIESTAPTTRDKRRVLLAEDSPINQEVALGLLELEGYHVTVVENGREAVERCQAERFDVILMDVEMPEMDGWEATLALRALEAERDTYTPIVALTAHAVADVRDRCREVGMDACVSKPIEPDELFQAIIDVTTTVCDKLDTSAGTP